MIEVIAQNSAQTKRPTIKMHKTKSARAKIWPFKNSFFNFCFCQSSRPIRNGCFGPPNFDRGLKTMISSDDRRAIKNDHLSFKSGSQVPCTI